MSNAELIPLNHFATVDAFRVRMHNVTQDAWYMFQACQNRRGDKLEFSCHVYSDAGGRFAAYVPAATVPGDECSFHANRRSCATGASLEELFVNLDVAHRPSELAMLRAMLSTRKLTCDGSVVGERIFQSPTAEEAEALRKRKLAFSIERIDREASDQLERARVRIAAARDEAVRLASAGVVARVTLEG